MAVNSDKPVLLGQDIRLVELAEVACRGRRVALCAQARAAVERARGAVEAIVAAGDDAPAVYGINTGFGALAETRIDAGDIATLQRNLVRSHACGVGPDLSEPQVRAMMVLRAQVVARGHSGVRIEVVDLLIDMLNAGVHPRIPSQGSVGASGDLAPLAHLALVLMGEGEAHYAGQLLAGGEALSRAGLAPLELAAKEGISLINGTQLMTAIGALALQQALQLCSIADVVGAMSVEALRASLRPFDARLMQLRAHPGQLATAANLRALLADSDIMASHVHCGKVQDPYSLRCMPQVHGASRDALAWACQVLAREVNSVTDNPTIFFADNGTTEVISGGNFHGQPLALALDMAAIATAELASISERRVEQMVNPALSSGLPPFLAPHSGVCSGFMIAHVTTAALVSENKVLAHPASVDSIPTSANREDHVSMGSISARKFAQVLDNVARSLAIELMVAAQGVECRAPLAASVGVRAAVAALRQRVPSLVEDRALYRDIEQAHQLVVGPELLQAVEGAVGTLT